MRRVSVIVVVGVLAAGCGSQASSTSATVTAPASASSSPSPAADSITGFGATDTAWNAHHTAATDSGLAPGCCYSPDPSLPQVNGHVGYRYFAVQHSNGRVLDYEMDLHPGTSSAEAKAEVLREFPPDATVLWFAVKASCAQMEIQSAALGKALAVPAIGDPAGEGSVELNTVHADGTSSYDARNINELIVSLGSYATAADSPAC